MSYEKIGWVSGETPLSATNLNHMEEGISTIDSAVGTDAYDPTKTYSKGDYFIYNDSLCKAIADIAAGAELLSGVNYSTTTVHEELTELNSNYLGKRIIGTIEDVTDNILIPDSIDRVFVRVFLQPEKDSSCIEFSFIKVFDDLAGDENILSGFYYSSTYYGSVGITSSGRYLSLDKSWWSFMWNGAKKTASSIYKFKMRVYY